MNTRRERLRLAGWYVGRGRWGNTGSGDPRRCWPVLSTADLALPWLRGRGFGWATTVLFEQLLSGVVLGSFLQLGNGSLALFDQVVEVVLRVNHTVVKKCIEAGAHSIDEYRCSGKGGVFDSCPVVPTCHQQEYKSTEDVGKAGVKCP